MTRRKTDKVTILVVDDDEKILFAFQQVFKRERYRCVVATSGAGALEKITAEHPAVVFMDIAMPALDGLDTLQRIKERDKTIPVIMITGHGTMQTAIKAMQSGAFDYLTKPLDVEKIRELTQKALANNRPASTGLVGHARLKADIIDRYELVGDSQAMQDIYKLIGSIAMTPNQTSVLVTGESGTGKELVARAIHHNSLIASEPFVAINCIALPETLLESELFGHERGSFTGAVERKLGKFEFAQRGSIFLDEIGTLSPALQQKLLRVLQEREFERVGGNETLHVLARFIAATNLDLSSEVKRKKFREDLFFRLNVVAIHLPPLRERREDIPLLAEYFLRKYTERIKKSIRGFSGESMDFLRRYSYPGNVRQLENIIERAVIFAKGDTIMPDLLREPMTVASADSSPLPIVSPGFSRSRAYILKVFESQFLCERLKKHRGNVTAAAEESNMTRQNFQRLMKKYKIKSNKFR